MTRLLLIRHGKTRLDGDERFWGQTDIELSEAGLKQAERLRDRLAGEKIATVYTSPLARARVTAEAIASGHKARIVLCDELCECNFGHVEGLTFNGISKRFPELAQKLAAWKAVAFPGGESLEQLNGRVGDFLARLKTIKEESTVAIVSHGGPLRLIVCNLLGLGLEHWFQLRVDHASLSVMETHPGGAILNLLNDVSHLKT